MKATGAGVWAVIPAGGDGRRLLPLTSRLAGDARPKQFCALKAVIAILFVVVVADPGAAQAPKGPAGGELYPLTPGGDRFFRLDWESVERCGRTLVRGYVVNDSPYAVGRMQLLVDSLDADDRVVAQSVSWVVGTLTPFSRLYFEAAVPRPAVKYRVRVFAYDRIEAAREFR